MKPLSLTIALLFCCGAGALADTATLQLQNPANGGANAGGVYTSPYNFSVNGSATTTQLVCDDYLNDITVGESWTASVTTLSGVIDSNSVSKLMFGSGSSINPALPTPNYAVPGYTVVQDYALDAVLVAELMSLTDLGSLQARNLSFAIWDVFDASAGDPTGDPQAAAYIASAKALVDAASSNGGSVVNLGGILVNGHAIESLTVYTPSSGWPQANGVPQEFLQVSMPEPSYPALLGLNLMLAVGLILAFRRRKASAK